ncbi:UNVERIFIED_CONTAM: hypothetical protein K2H54_053427 [Gekko kuhli]
MCLRYNHSPVPGSDLQEAETRRDPTPLVCLGWSVVQLLSPTPHVLFMSLWLMEGFHLCGLAESQDLLFPVHRIFWNIQGTSGQLLLGMCQFPHCRLLHLEHT